MKIPPIETEEEYEDALVRLEALLEAKDGSSEANEREALLEAIEEYEDEIYPITALPKKD
jgi:HTH-type transcriptional regulator / antitoxin HigA